MKVIILFVSFIMANAYAKPVLVLSAFDTFGTSPFNNSEVVARKLVKELKQTNDFPVEIELCLLPTVYDLAEEKLSRCVAKFQGQELIGVISLGEAFCSIKIETMATNYDKNTAKGSSADNHGQRRDAPIINGASEKLGFTLPLDELYCSLTKEEKKHSLISVDTGSFVCNNTAYLFRHNNPNTPYTFVHLPANNCNNLDELNSISSSIIKKLILKTLESYEKRLTHSFPLNKKDAREMMRQNDGCYRDFYRELRKAL